MPSTPTTTAVATASAAVTPSTPARRGVFRAASLVALGVVYGDIGTSPLYALKECFSGEYGVPPSLDNVLGVLSLVFWALTWVVVIKYLTVLLRADNDGEGGIMALIALLTPSQRSGEPRDRRQLGIIFLGIFGAALLYGDGVITPAVSVLSAVEGLEVAAPYLKPVIIPATVAILILLFAVQKRGTEHVGRIFGPVMAVWFGAIALVALPWIAREPRVFLALNPLVAAEFVGRNGMRAVMVLTAVVLCVTGAEALYADMGAFGPGPIRRAWYAVVYPALILNYFGQGAALMFAGPAALENPFFALVPKPLVVPMVVLATLATVIASQALISGVFSMTRQAIVLGFMPRFQVVHTSSEEEGQVYLPRLNLFLLVACVALVIAFRSSARLTGAYGIAVTGTMAISSILFFGVSRKQWKWPLWAAAALSALFIAVDTAFLLPNLAKIEHGGWVPLAIGAAIFVLMTTWHRGRELLGQRWVAQSLPFGQFAGIIASAKPVRVKGTGIFLASQAGLVPALLRQQFRHYHALHERIILIVPSFAHVPHVRGNRHVQVSELGEGFFQAELNYGFMESPDFREVIDAVHALAPGVNSGDCTFFVPQDMLTPGPLGGMAKWRKRLFILVARNVQATHEFRHVRPEWVIHTGGLIEI